MKKILLALLIGTATVAATSSCTKEYITNYLPGISYTPTIHSSDWDESATGFYATDIDFPELDEVYYQSGTVQVAIKRAGQTGFDVIPATIDGVHYSFSYDLGVVTLYAEDRNVNYFPPDNMLVKVTLTDADDGGN